MTNGAKYFLVIAKKLRWTWIWKLIRCHSSLTSEFRNQDSAHPWLGRRRRWLFHNFHPSSENLRAKMVLILWQLIRQRFDLDRSRFDLLGYCPAPPLSRHIKAVGFILFRNFRFSFVCFFLFFYLWQNYTIYRILYEYIFCSNERCSNWK